MGTFIAKMGSEVSRSNPAICVWYVNEYESAPLGYTEYPCTEASAVAAVRNHGSYNQGAAALQCMSVQTLSPSGVNRSGTHEFIFGIDTSAIELDTGTVAIGDLPGGFRITSLTLHWRGLNDETLLGLMDGVTVATWVPTFGSGTDQNTDRFVEIETDVFLTASEVFSRSFGFRTNHSDVNDVLLVGHFWISGEYTPVTVTAVTPDHGRSAGGTPITVTGTGFVDGATVEIDGTACTDVVFVSDTSITCVSPAGTMEGPKDVAVINPDTSSGILLEGYTYVPITIDPIEGPSRGETSFIITDPDEAFVSGMVVLFNGVPATAVTFVNPQHIGGVTPAIHVGLASVDVYLPGMTFLFTLDFTYTGFTVDPVEDGAFGGNVAMINGTDFVEGMTISFGLKPDDSPNLATAVVLVSSVRLSCITPSHDVGPVTVTLTRPGEPEDEISIDAFTYLPEILPPIGGPKGKEPFLIYWDEFVEGMTVTFAGVPATAITIQDDKHLTGLTPPHRSAQVDVIITHPSNGSARTLVAAYRYSMNISPTTGPVVGGETVFIQGGGFSGETSITFDGVAATNIVVEDGSNLRCEIPAHAAGRVDVVVTTPGEVTETLSLGFTYVLQIDAPLIQMGPSLTAHGPLPAAVVTNAVVTIGINGGTATYLWEQISGPSIAIIATPTSVNTIISFSEYVPGTYTFRLTVETHGAIEMEASATLAVLVEVPRPPEVRIGNTTIVMQE